MSRSTAYTRRPPRALRAAPVRTATLPEQNESAQLLAALKVNQQLLRDLMLRYDAGRAPVTTLHRRKAAPTIRSPQDVYNLFGEEMSRLLQEQLRVLLLDTKHRMMRWQTVYQGTVDSMTVRPAELLRPAVLENAPAIIPVHNHPGGILEPSPEDIQTTEHAMAAGDLLSIDMLDHVVLGKEGRFTSPVGEHLVRRPPARGAA